MDVTYPTSGAEQARPRPGARLGLRRAVLVAASVAAGAVLAAAWSFELVDDVVAGTVATAMMGQSAADVPLTGVAMGSLFAFATGLAGTLTACNVAVFGALGPLLESGASARSRLAAVLPPLGWMGAAMVAVAAAYGAMGALLGPRLPQLSDAATAGGMPLRLVQSSAVFTLLGLLLCYVGLGAAGVVPDLLGRLRQRWAHAPLVLIGAVIGGFLVGRPFPMFRRLFAHAAELRDPLYGALVFALQSIGNTVVVGTLFALVALLAGRRLGNWLAAGQRAQVLVTVTFLTLGAFTVLYWGLRVPARFGYGWFPFPL